MTSTTENHTTTLTPRQAVQSALLTLMSGDMGGTHVAPANVRSAMRILFEAGQCDAFKVTQKEATDRNAVALLQGAEKRSEHLLADFEDAKGQAERLAESLAAMHDRALDAEGQVAQLESAYGLAVEARTTAYAEAQSHKVAYASAMEARDAYRASLVTLRNDAEAAFEASMATLNDDGTHIDAAAYFRGTWDALIEGEMDDSAVVAGQLTSCDRAYRRGFTAGKEEGKK